MEHDSLPQPSAGADRQPPPSAFAAQPREFRPGSGCGRLALIGCGLGMLLMGIAAVVAVLRVNDILAWTLSVLQTQVEQRLPDGLDEGTRRRLSTAFDGARRAIRRGEVEPTSLEALQQQLMKLAAPAEGRLSRGELDSLVEVLERIAGQPAAEPSPSPPAELPLTASSDELQGDWRESVPVAA